MQAKTSVRYPKAKVEQVVRMTGRQCCLRWAPAEGSGKTFEWEGRGEQRVCDEVRIVRHDGRVAVSLAGRERAGPGGGL